MKILILSIGTRGDVQPYVALGIGLKRAGHQVTICTCDSFEPFVTQYGLEFAKINDELIEFLHSDDGKNAMENSGNLWECLKRRNDYCPNSVKCNSDKSMMPGSQLKHASQT